MSGEKLRLGVAGLGRGFMLMRPTLLAHPALSVVAAADPRPAARAQFLAEFGAAHPVRGMASVAELCADSAVEAVYLATPHQFHAEHAKMAAAAGKHLLVEKPMALSLSECQAMIAAISTAGVQMVVGHSHSFDAPVALARRLIASGAHGRVRMIHALNCTDFLYRPRRPEELDTAQGGGVMFSQAAHQVDIVRLLAGGQARQVRAMLGSWDAARPAEGAYTALVGFADGVAASLGYSGYGRFDTDEFCGWVGETGRPRDPAAYGTALRALRQNGPVDEAALKDSIGYGAAVAPPAPVVAHEHFGFMLVQCEHADLRLLPDGVMVYGAERREKHALPAPPIPRAEVIDEFFAAVRHGVQPLHSGAWAMATLEVCLAMLESGRRGQEVALQHQVAAEMP